MGDGTGRRGEALPRDTAAAGPRRDRFPSPTLTECAACSSGPAGKAELTPLDFQIPLGRTMEDALAFVLEMGPLSAPLGEVTSENRTRAIDAINRVLEDNTCDDGIVRLSRLLDRYGAGGLKPSVSSTTSPTNRARVSAYRLAECYCLRSR